MTWHNIYPVGSGHALRVVNIAKMLGNKYDVMIVAINHKKNPHFVELDQRLGSIRIIQKDFSAVYPRFFYALSCLAFSYPFFYPKKVRSYLADITEGAHIVQIESLRLFKFVHKKGTRFVLDEHNIEWERISYKTAFPYNLLSRIWKVTAGRFEKKAIKSSSLVLVTSERDKMMILDALKDVENEKFAVIPNCIDMAEYLNPDDNDGLVRAAPHGRPVILFMGSLDYFPNRDAVDLILDQIAPRVPEFDFLIVGRGREAGQSTQLKNVKFTGYVDDIRRPIADSDVCICPLRYGSGTRLKILEYMIMGKPVVSTTKGAEGLGINNGLNICLEDDISLFADRVKELLRDAELYRTLQTNGKKFVIERYDWRAYSDLITDRYSRIIQLAAE